jgi:hypothetical protein
LKQAASQQNSLKKINEKIPHQGEGGGWDFQGMQG